MIELKDDGLMFSFPEVHRDAQCRIGFQHRTARLFAHRHAVKVYDASGLTSPPLLNFCH